MTGGSTLTLAATEGDCEKNQEKSSDARNHNRAHHLRSPRLSCQQAIATAASPTQLLSSAVVQNIAPFFMPRECKNRNPLLKIFFRT